jgi:1,4-dihydroxy-2-naphthoate octaprenyltransferase
MTASAISNQELARLEYEQALNQYQNCTVLRRQDMAFVTTAQGAVLAVLGPKLLELDFTGFLLSFIACFLLVLGLNSERRLSRYMDAYSKRAIDIEDKLGLSLIKDGSAEAHNKRLLYSNSTMFPIYYSLLILGWAVIWIRNILE